MENLVKTTATPVHRVQPRRTRCVLKPRVTVCPEDAVRRHAATRRAVRRGVGGVAALGLSLAGHALALYALLTWGLASPRSTLPENETTWEVLLTPPPPVTEPEPLIEMPAARPTDLPQAVPDWPAMTPPPEAPPLPAVWMEARLTPPPQEPRVTDVPVMPPEASAPDADVNDPFWTEVRARIARELNRRRGRLSLHEASAVVVRLAIDENGALTEVAAEAWFGSPAFKQAALESVRAAAPYPKSDLASGPRSRTARVPLRYDPEG